MDSATNTTAPNVPADHTFAVTFADRRDPPRVTEWTTTAPSWEQAYDAAKNEAARRKLSLRAVRPMGETCRYTVSRGGHDIETVCHPSVWADAGLRALRPGDSSETDFNGTPVTIRCLG